MDKLPAAYMVCEAVHWGSRAVTLSMTMKTRQKFLNDHLNKCQPERFPRRPSPPHPYA